MVPRTRVLMLFNRPCRTIDDGQVTRRVASSRIGARVVGHHDRSGPWVCAPQQGSPHRTDRPAASAPERRGAVAAPVPVAPGHWMHHLELHDLGDVDDEVEAWLCERRTGRSESSQCIETRRPLIDLDVSLMTSERLPGAHGPSRPVLAMARSPSRVSASSVAPFTRTFQPHWFQPSW